jgi:glycosyltransferase involved in cell wall biosynthesis
MRILQITKYYYPCVSFGGPVQCTYNLSKYLIKRGHDVTVYTTDAAHISTRARIKERFQLINGVKVFFFRNVTRFYGFFISPGIISALRRNLNDFDVVHLHEYRTFQNLAFYYSRRNDNPYVLTLHGQLEIKQESADVSLLRRLYNNSFGRSLLRDASSIFALTEVEALQLVRRGVERDKIAIIPNAVDPEDFSDPPPKGCFKSFIGLKDEEVILYLGRISPLKGLGTLVRAFSLLKGPNNFKLVLAGPDDGIKDSLQQVIKKLKLEGKVLFTGSLNRREVLSALNDASVAVYASLQEGFPILPLEAGIMGTPIIVSNHPSMNFVKKGQFGLSVDYGNVEQLKEALERVLADEELAAKLSENGRRFVRSNFTWDKVAKKVESVYREVAG